jgi:hypothetical protein
MSSLTILKDCRNPSPNRTQSQQTDFETHSVSPTDLSILL